MFHTYLHFLETKDTAILPEKKYHKSYNATIELRATRNPFWKPGLCESSLCSYRSTLWEVPLFGETRLREKLILAGRGGSNDNRRNYKRMRDPITLCRYYIGPQNSVSASTHAGAQLRAPDIQPRGSATRPYRRGVIHHPGHNRVAISLNARRTVARKIAWPQSVITNRPFSGNSAGTFPKLQRPDTAVFAIVYYRCMQTLHMQKSAEITRLRVSCYISSVIYFNSSLNKMNGTKTRSL